MSAPEANRPSEGVDDELILDRLGEFRERTRATIYELVLHEFTRSSLTQAELARRLGKNPSIISRLLSSPGNWSLDTVSDLLFAISGGELHATVTHGSKEAGTDRPALPDDAAVAPPPAKPLD